VGRLFTKKVDFFLYFGAAFPPPAPIEVKFCTAKRAHMPVGCAKFDVNRCNESPLRCEKTDFWPVSKSNTGSFPLHGILPVTRKNVHSLSMYVKQSIISKCQHCTGVQF